MDIFYPVSIKKNDWFDWFQCYAFQSKICPITIFHIYISHELCDWFHSFYVFLRPYWIEKREREENKNYFSKQYLEMSKLKQALGNKNLSSCLNHNLDNPVSLIISGKAELYKKIHLRLSLIMNRNRTYQIFSLCPGKESFKLSDL